MDSGEAGSRQARTSLAQFARRGGAHVELCQGRFVIPRGSRPEISTSPLAVPRIVPAAGPRNKGAGPRFVAHFLHRCHPRRVRRRGGFERGDFQSFEVESESTHGPLRSGREWFPFANSRTTVPARSGKVNNHLIRCAKKESCPEAPARPGCKCALLLSPSATSDGSGVAESAPVQTGPLAA
jgi:hypothetical protein